MKFVASVSLAALALAGCTTAAAEQGMPVAASDSNAAPAVVADALPYPATPEGARQFVADVEKDLFDLSVIGGRAQWENATYINDDTDPLADYFGTIGTEKGVKYASQAAQFS
jgi:peptidyl-dipeptidase A